MTDISHLKDQAARDAAPTVAPVEGCYKLLRRNEILSPSCVRPQNGLVWHDDGKAEDPYSQRFRPELDIIGVIPPDRLFAPDQSAEVARLRSAVCRMRDDYQTSKGHHPDHVLVRLGDFHAALAALEDIRIG